MALLGPTASGKSEAAVRIAHRLEGEILSVDSMQIYRGMDVGTAKPTVVEREGVPHHMIDIVEPEDEFSVAEFRVRARRVIEETSAPALIITGGSGLHFRALVDPLSFAPTDPQVRADLESTSSELLMSQLLDADAGAGDHIDLANRRRVVRALEVLRLTGETPSDRAASAEAESVRRYESEFSFIAAGMDPGPAIEVRIEKRVEDMRRGGLLDEVRRLRPRLGRTARSAVGYREIVHAIDHDEDLDRAFTLVTRNTKKLARRQRTWFRRDPRIQWIPWTDDVESRCRRLLEIYG